MDTGDSARPDGSPHRVAPTVTLRDVVETDLPIFFEQQRDPEANVMVAFTSRDPEDREGFMAHWDRVLAEETNTIKTILADGAVAGHIVCFEYADELMVGYWIDRSVWGRGIASQALAAFLDHVTSRPLHARVAKDNAGSLRVLQKCGFKIYGEDSGFAFARNTEVEEWMLRLESDGDR